ncbi:MAG: acyl carrier protein [Rhodospirillales bacterium]|nr:acyl carrier protein [Rhodospirillales bacterium]
MTATDDRLRSVILDTLKAVAPDGDVENLDPGRSFHDQLDIDSVDFLNFAMALERRLGVRVAEVDYPRLSSLDGCLAYLTPRITAIDGPPPAN